MLVIANIYFNQHNLKPKPHIGVEALLPSMWVRKDTLTNMLHQIFFRHLCLILIFLAGATQLSAVQIELPELGGSTSAIVSIEQERQLGQSWLRSFRSQADLDEDYIIQEYTENLIYSMLPNASLADSNIDVLIVNNPSLNAFAVPGGVLGVNTGLFLYAQTEDQLCSVLAHELAHLKQRHFARSVQEQKGSTITTMAGILASVILAATAGSDAGLAALAASQSLALESRLSYSRQNEQEADRIGLEILAKSGRDPNAMTGMFEQMLKATRFSGYRAPEYLSSHPLTESRVNDAGNRARQFSPRIFEPSPNYQLIQTRIRVALASSAQQAAHEMSLKYENNPTRANQYGLALAYSRSLKTEEALSISKSLYSKEPSNQLLALLYTDALSAAGKTSEAKELLLKHLRFKPRSYSLNMALAQIHIHESEYEKATNLYRTLSKQRPNDVLVWYEYSEALGLAGKILELHKSRAQYFTLIGAYQRAIRQLQYAKKEATGDGIELAILDKRISDTARLLSNSAF